MFDNIGGKIKVFSVIAMVVGILFSLIYGIVLLVGGAIAVGLLVLFGGPFLSWICIIVLYGLGELIDKTAETADNTRKLLQLNAINSINSSQKIECPPATNDEKAKNPGAKAKPVDNASSNEPSEAPAQPAPTNEHGDTIPPFIKVLQDEILTDVMAGALSDKTGEDIDPVNIPKANECPACFHPISPDDEYCDYCGQKLK